MNRVLMRRVWTRRGLKRFEFEVNQTLATGEWALVDVAIVPSFLVGLMCLACFECAHCANAHNDDGEEEENHSWH